MDLQKEWDEKIHTGMLRETMPYIVMTPANFYLQIVQ